MATKLYPKLLLYVLLLLTCWIRIQGINTLPSRQFLSNDAYLFAAQSEEIADHGKLPARDMRRWLPYGRDNEQLLSLYAYAIAYTHKIIGWLFPKLTVYHIQLYAPPLCLRVSDGKRPPWDVCFIRKKSRVFRSTLTHWRTLLD